ncbi:trypsin-like peptidase domain-containing protein [Streptomyces sp. NPDC051214]|uniref:trypsin-like peptidase domain-containing protein n=1 Tax=Streptomyces sp. NPDC051214 TaxID=3155282 RepID=UPI00341FDE65
MSHLDRVVQIVRREPGGRSYFRASGFLLVGDVAITTAHAVRERTLAYEVRPLRQALLASRLMVRRVVIHAERDLALLILDADQEALPPLRFGELPHDLGQTEVHAVGFPGFAVEDAVRRAHQIDGTVQLGSDRTDHQLQLSVRSSDPPRGEVGGSPWAGYSGAGILTKREGLLVGIAASHRPDGDRKNTTGTDLAGLRDPAFIGTLTAHGIDTTPIPVLPEGGRSAVGPPHWLPPPVRAALALQREEADELPHHFRQDRQPRTLTAVYVRQKLSQDDPREDEAATARADGLESPAERRAGRGPGPVGGPGSAGPGTHPTQHIGPPRLLDDVLRDASAGTHLLVQAEPGAGKSTLLHHSALRLGEEALAAAAGSGKLVPLLVTANQLVGEGRSLEGAVASATHLDAGTGTLPRLPYGAIWLVLVDALDEVHQDHRSLLIHRLAAHARLGARSALRVLLTSRFDDEAMRELTRAGFTNYVLQPFDGKALETFAHAWFRDSGRPDLAPDFLAQAKESELGDLLRFPLFATITAFVFLSAPHQPLPESRWALYQEFRVHLRAARQEYLEAFWRKLESRAEATAQARRAVAYLRNHGEALLTHLAHAQVTAGADDLPEVARQWWENHAVDPQGRHFGADPPLDGWFSAVTDTVLASGLVIRRRGRWEFLHATFAEHLAAEQLVGTLPENFDPQAEIWRRAVVAASGITDHPHTQLYRAALVHFCNRRRESGRVLLDWLQTGLHSRHVLAGALLAEGCPAEDHHYERLLEAVETYRCLGSGSALWNHLGGIRQDLVRAYLRNTASRPGDPGQVLAATALIPHDPTAAADVLAGLANDARVDFYDLDYAVDLLTESTRGDTAAAARARVALTGRRLADSYQRLSSAESLAALGEKHRDSAGRALTALAEDTGTPWSEREMAVEQLAELGGAHRERAAQLYARAAAEPGNGIDRQLDAASALSSLDATFHPDAARAYRAVADAPFTNGWGRLRALTALADLGGSYLTEATLRTRVLFGPGAVGPHEWWSYMRGRAYPGSVLAEQRAAILRALVESDDEPFPTRLTAARGLLRLGWEYAEEAVQRVENSLVNSPAPLGDRLVAQDFVAAGPHQAADDMLDLLRDMIKSQRAPWHRSYAIHELAPCRAVRVEEMAETITASLLGDRSWNHWLNRDLSALRELGDPHLAQVTERLHERLTAEDTPVKARRTVTHLLLALGASSSLAPAHLHDVIVDLSVGDEDGRRRAAAALRDRGAGCMREAVREFQGVLTDRRTGPFVRQSVSRALRELGEESVRFAAEGLASELSRPDAAPRTHRRAVRALLTLEGPYVPLADDTLRDIIGARGTAFPERLLALRILLCLSPQHIDEAARDLCSPFRHYRLNSVKRHRAAIALLEPGTGQQRRATRLLKAALRSRLIRVDAAPILDRLGHTAAAARALRRTAHNPRLDVYDLCKIADRLIAFGDAYAPYAARILCGTLRSRRADGYDRVELMARLIRLGDQYHHAAARAATRASRRWQGYGSEEQELVDLMLSGGEEYRPLAAEALLGFIVRRGVSADDRDRAVVAVLSLGPEFRDRTVLALWRVARRRKRPRKRPYDQERAKNTLVRLAVEEAVRGSVGVR